MSERDEQYMRMALSLADKARGRTSPNPLVGAVVVKEGRIVGRGWHKRAGEPHAEAIALRKAGSKAKGATLYVTLEPCSHLNKRTPPCTPLVIQSGVTRVVVAMIDPNPLVSGRGIRILKASGIDVVTGVMEQKARRLNEAFIKHVTTGMPFVTLKIAQTLDGKIATARGESQWITGEEARRDAHRLRDGNDAILVGVNTVLKDDPSLTTRIPGGRDAVRVIVDSTLRTPVTAKVLTGQSAAGTIIATVPAAPLSRINKLRNAGAEVLVVRSAKGRVDLRDLLKKLGGKGIMSVLVEGGAEINASILHGGLADKAVLFVAPMFMTGVDSLGSIGGRSPMRLKQAVRLTDVASEFVGQDIRIEGYIRKAP